MPRPQMLHEKYAKAVVAIETTQFELRRIVKDLKKNLEFYSNDAHLNAVYGSALCRLGNYEEGIAKLKYSTFLESSNDLMMTNLIKAYIENGDFDLAYELHKKSNFPTDLYLDGLFGNVKDERLIDLGIKDDFIRTTRLISGMTPYGTSHAVEIEYDMKKLIVSIEVDVYMDIESVFRMYQKFIEVFVEKVSEKGLKHIITNFRSLV